MAPLYRSTGYGVPSGTAPLSPGLPGCRTLRMPMTLIWTVTLPKERHIHRPLEPFSVCRRGLPLWKVLMAVLLSTTLLSATQMEGDAHDGTATTFGLTFDARGLLHPGNWHIPQHADLVTARTENTEGCVHPIARAAHAGEHSGRGSSLHIGISAC